MKMKMRINAPTLWRSDLMRRAAKDSILKLDPRVLWHHPVMFIVETASVVATLAVIGGLFTGGHFRFDVQITVWLWSTVLFANFAEALAEGWGRAQANSLRQAQSEAVALRLLEDGRTERIPARELRKGDIVQVKDGEIIPGDGEIMDGAALVDESAITGESAPVVREPGGSLCGVTGGTRLISGQIKVSISADPGETFLDQMIAMVESARRQKTPNEWALEILLIAMTAICVVVVATLVSFAGYMGVIICDKGNQDDKA